MIWGDLIGYNDYLDLAFAVTDSITARDYEPLLDFFGDQVDSMWEDLSEGVQELGEPALRDLLLRAFMGKGESIQEGRLEISAGIAQFDFWYEFSWGEPRTYKCKLKEKWTGWWTWGPCTTVETKRVEIYQLPKFRPYIRYRVSGLPELPTSDVVQRVEAAISNLAKLSTSEVIQRVEAEIQGQPMSTAEIERIVSEKILEIISEQLPEIPIHNIQPMIVAAVEEVIDQHGTDDIPLIIDKIIEQVDDAIANEISRSTVEVERIITEQVLQLVEELLAQIPIGNIQPMVLATVQQVIAEAGTDDIPLIIDKIVEQVDDAITDSISTYSGSLIFDWARSNRPEVRNKIKENGWHVVWGVNLDEIEYAKFALAVAAAGPSGGATLTAYFQEYLYRTLNKVQKQAPQIGREVLEDVLVQALSNPGELLKIGNLQIVAGVATYDRWLQFPYPTIREWPPIKGCEWIDWKGIKVEGYCVDIEEDTFETNLPNHHQPYIKLRFDTGATPEPDSGSQPAENRVYFERCRYLDDIHVDGNAHKDGNGTSASPLVRISRAVNCVKPGGTMWITAGNYNEPIAIISPMTLRSTGGAVTIGVE